MSALKVKRRGFCNDCGLPHDRPSPNVALCFACRKARLIKYRRTTWRKYQQHWNRSPKAKLYKAEWEDRNREHVKQVRHAYYMRTRPRMVRLTPCHAVRCNNTFVRPKSSHRKWCDDCAVAFFGDSYLRWRSITRGRSSWRRAA